MTKPVAVVPPPVMERIRARAEEAYAEECCGFLAGLRDEGPGSALTVRIFDEVPTRNVAAEEDRSREFLVEPKAVLEIMKRYRDRDEDVVGFYHSHPDHEAGLSPTDLEFARLWPRTVWLIVPVHDGRAGEERAWWLPGADRAPDSQVGRGGRAERHVTRDGNDAEEGKQDDTQPEAAQQMIIRSSASAERAVTPRGETA